MLAQLGSGMSDCLGRPLDRLCAAYVYALGEQDWVA